jgi:hypothetical protein
MLLGKPKQFAIEAIVLDIVDRTVSGKLRFHINGRCFGDFDDTSLLSSSMYHARLFLSASPRRTRIDLETASSEDVYEQLYGRYVVPIQDLYSISGSSGKLAFWDREPYVLDDIGESSLRDKYALIATRISNGADRVILKSFNDDSLWESQLPSRMLDDTLMTYCAWVGGMLKN